MVYIYMPMYARHGMDGIVLRLRIHVRQGWECFEFALGQVR